MAVRKLAFAAIFFCFLAVRVDAFTPQPPLSSSSSASSLQLNEVSSPSVSLPSKTKVQDLSSWMNRPMRRDANDNNALLLSVLDQAEITTGRVAMIAAIVLIAQEIATGESFLHIFEAFLGTNA